MMIVRFNKMKWFVSPAALQHLRKWACININLRELWHLSQHMVLNNDKSYLYWIGMVLNNSFSYKTNISLHPKQELFSIIQRQKLTSKSHKRLDSSVLIFLTSFTRWQPKTKPNLYFSCNVQLLALIWDQKKILKGESGAIPLEQCLLWLGKLLSMSPLWWDGTWYNYQTTMFRTYRGEMKCFQSKGRTAVF